MKIQLPALNADEVYLCGLIVPTGALQHTILVPGDAEPDSWDHQMQWARDDGFDLLDRVEYAFVHQHWRGLFQPTAYWTNAQEGDSGWAWFQSFHQGYQDQGGKNLKLRARRCRRVIVQGE